LALHKLRQLIRINEWWTENCIHSHHTIATPLRFNSDLIVYKSHRCT